ncbi:phospholipid phosphatase 1-like [Haliotis rubra]|uniref:phospholipid phosphatase 1-like n=1 Tax=Haliotis rubra TaxID=36100 RepID=UPI001EE5868E|nr:phospholipid phosphatase 1-like [Haliotis rubra]
MDTGRSCRGINVIKVVGDVVITLLMLLFVGVLEKYGVPFRQGFFCDDDTIKYPYKQSTISVTLLMMVSLGVPLVVMVVWDALFKVYKLRGAITCHAVLRGVFDVALVFLFGGALTFAVTDIGKYSIGRLRPHFIFVCHPDLITACAEGYIQNYTCEGSDKQAISEARLSFPSGHSSISFFGMTYFAVFLYARLPKSSPRLLKPFAMALVLSVAFYISLSRVFDYWHHPGDVIFGSLLGASIGVTMSIFVARLPSTPEKPEADDTSRRKIVNFA